MKTVNLVATMPMIQRYFPDHRAPNPNSIPGIMSADFPIVSQNCTTKLGAWLATHISTTRFDDDLSKLKLVLPTRVIEMAVRQKMNEVAALRIRDRSVLEQLKADLDRWFEHQISICEVYGPHPFGFVTTQFQWPVFGAAASKGDTPEGYFDPCAGVIRSMRPTHISSWSGLTPPQSLMESMRA